MQLLSQDFRRISWMEPVGNQASRVIKAICSMLDRFTFKISAYVDKEPDMEQMEKKIWYFQLPSGKHT